MNLTKTNCPFIDCFDIWTTDHGTAILVLMIAH